MQIDTSGTKAGAESIREKRIRSLINNLQTEMQKILSSCILTENYPATTIAFQFTILEMDSELLQSMINCASLALYKSDISSRCLPIAITMLLVVGK
jgi:ribonuclease PH